MHERIRWGRSIQGNGHYTLSAHVRVPTSLCSFFFFWKFRFFDCHLIRRLHHISCKRTLFIDDCDPMLDVRLQWLRLQCAIELGDFELADALLNHIDACFIASTTSHPIESIHLPNQMYCKIVDRSVIASELVLLNCLQLMQQCLWQPHCVSGWQQRHGIREMLLKHRQCKFESKYLSRWQQYEMLAEWHWCAGQFDECLRWCEIDLNESVQCMRLAQQRQQNANTPIVCREFLQHIRFVTVYVEHLVDGTDPRGMAKSVICFYLFIFFATEFVMFLIFALSLSLTLSLTQSSY